MVRKIYILIFFGIQFLNCSAQVKATINIKDFGSKGDGKKDNTTDFQNAIDFLASKKGGNLIIPKGIYKISHLKFFGNKYSNINIVGDGAIINQILPKNRIAVRGATFKTYAKRYAADGCFVFDALVSNQKDDQNSIVNIKLRGLKFVTNVVENGFDELLHQISAHGVSNFTVENCSFTGFLGDGIAINSATDFTTYTYAYNKNVKITNCKFDGINKDNRQGISIYYCDGFVIDTCSFKNITRPDMPGAIDIEPDRDFLVTRNGLIRKCTFENIGGLGAICIIVEKSTQKNAFSNRNYIIDECVFNNVNTSLCIIGNETYDNFSSGEKIVTFRNSTVKNASSPVDLRSAYGIHVLKVSFENMFDKIKNIVTDIGATNITFEECKFKKVANPNGLGFHGNTSGINFINNEFEDFAIHAITINSIKGVGKIIDNKFLSTAYKNGLPLVTQNYSNDTEISRIVIKNNLSYENFDKLDITHFFKKKL
ncbi:glycosyl hydrolase family 28-related protein [Pedobacter agri]|uniref:glycosyl hydrolase family 28-related protein n=1 Tax=Pedobacter agri TaxID=454586 RepID=UPI0027838D8E|nr:glycosyl hydrolase family 28-related protein [Pedobacter agri]MDQ1141131.1 polygalacturonase [Pedobacter agri]